MLIPSLVRVRSTSYGSGTDTPPPHSRTLCVLGTCNGKEEP